MTRDEQRAVLIEANALALARNMFPEHNLRTLDELSPLLKQHFLSTGKDAFDAQHGLARVNPIETTEEMRMAVGADMRWEPRNSNYLRCHVHRR